MKGKKSWIDLLDEKEKGYLKWLLILTCVGSATIIILNYFFDINIHIQKSIKQNMCIGLVLLAFSIISLLNAFSSKNCRIKKISNLVLFFTFTNNDRFCNTYYCQLKKTNAI